MDRSTNRIIPVQIKPKDFEGSWKQVQENCPTLSNWGVSLLRTGLDKYVKTVVVETNYTCKDHRNLFSYYYSKKFVIPDAFCYRLHFFSEDISDPLRIIFDVPDLKDHYLGFSIIRPVAERCIGRTIIDPEKIGLSVKNGFYCLCTSFEVSICGAIYKVKGYPYMSQDTDATVCAHSALWGVCRFLSEKYHHYKEVYPFDLIKMTGNMMGRTFPYRGMTYNDYSTILSEFGSFPVIIRIKELNGPKVSYDINCFYDLCSYIESGFPTLASYIYPGHVVALCGHTLDYSKVPSPDKNGFIQSADFVKQFIVVDDNYFPYALLGSPSDPSNYGGYAIDSIHTAVCPLPEKAFLPAEKARQKTIEYFISIRSKLDKLGFKPPFVIRLLLTTCRSFKKEKLTYFQNNLDPLLAFPAEVNFPHFIWLAELYTIKGYKDRKCIAEIILDATAGLKENGTIYLRTGNIVYFNDSYMKNPEAPLTFIQYTHNLGEATI